MSNLKHTYTHKGKILLHEKEPKTYTGILFRFAEVSENRTAVKRTATIRACSDAINVEHRYPPAHEYKAVGHVKRFYYQNDALYIDFVVYDEYYQKLVEDGTLSLSVSWFATEPEKIDGVDWFDDIVIYEVSLVGIPAFNTCAAPLGEPLACVHSDKGCENEKKDVDSVYLGAMVVKHQEDERIAALEQSVQKLIEDNAAIQQQILDLVARLEALEQSIAQMKEQADMAIEEAKQVASKVEGIMGDIVKNNHALDELAKLTHRLTMNLANLIRK